METPTRSTNVRTSSGNELLTRISSLARGLANCFGTLVGLDEQGVIEDIAQDVVLDCLIKLRTGQWDVEPGSVRVYVRNAVRMRTVDHLRRAAPRDDREAEHGREMWEGTHAWMEPDVAWEDRELSELYASSLASLSDVCRGMYLMIREDGATYDEVAERFGVTRSAVNANVVRAHAAFRARLLERGIAPPRVTKSAARKPAIATIGPTSDVQLASCFPAGTLIRLADGSERAIERVRPNESVVTAEGRTGMVRRLLVRRENESMIRLTTWGHAPVYLTPEHPVLTKHGYVGVNAFQLGDWVGLTRYRPRVRAALDVCDVSSLRERDSRTGLKSTAALDRISDEGSAVAPIPDRIPLTARFGRLVGLFLGAGTTNSRPLHFAFDPRDAGPLAEECVDVLSDLGVDAEISSGANTKTYVLVFGSEWDRLWERLCGARAVDRMVNPLLMGDDAFLRAMLDGWLACEGYAPRKKGRAPHTVGSTISKVLAFEMFDIAQALGLRPMIRRCPPTAQRQKAWYEVEIDPQLEKSDNEHSEMDTAHVWRRVRGIEQLAFDGMVYNLSVEGDQSYVAEGIAVHNCAADRP